MPRPTYPHSVDDLVRAVDGPFGLVVGDVPDGTLWMLKRGRKTPGYELVHYSDTERTRVLDTREIADRADAIAAMARAIGL